MWSGGRGAPDRVESIMAAEPRLEVRMMMVFLNETTLPCTPTDAVSMGLRLGYSASS